MTDEIKRDDSGRFVSGASGNPRGRPKGIPNKGTISLVDMVKEATPYVLERFMERLYSGDQAAHDFFMSRLWPSAGSINQQFLAVVQPEVYSQKEEGKQSRYCEAGAKWLKSIPTRELLRILNELESDDLEERERVLKFYGTDSNSANQFEEG